MTTLILTHIIDRGIKTLTEFSENAQRFSEFLMPFPRLMRVDLSHRESTEGGNYCKL